MNYSKLGDISSPKDTFPWYHATLHVASLLFAVAIVALFPILHFSPWYIPTTYSLKDSQQFFNFFVVVLALLLSLLMTHCLSITNEIEAQVEYSANTLSIARLEARSQISRRGIPRLLRLLYHNLSLWDVSTSYIIAICAFSGLSWILSIVFVLELIISPHELHSTGHLALGNQFPRFPDPCRQSLTAANCTYDLAASALASQLITHTPYTFANVTFSGPAGTQALPFEAMKDFASLAVDSKFGEEQSRYCLPVMNTKLASCSPVQNEGRANYTYITSRFDPYLQRQMNTFEITINPNTPYNQSYVATDSVATNNGGVGTGASAGVMAVSRSKIPSEIIRTILTGSGQYADLLSRLATRNSINYTIANYNETIFTVMCDAPFDQNIYSWQWVTFTLNGGVMTALPSNETCQVKTEPVPLAWLDYALEDATAASKGTDGYSKYFNTDFLAQEGPEYDLMKEFGMSPLEYIHSQVIGIVNTAWTTPVISIANSSDIQELRYGHNYMITVTYEGITILALVVSCLVLLCVSWQAWKWYSSLAVLRKARSNLSKPNRYWQLLDTLQLLDYGATATTEISKLRLSNQQQRNKVLRSRYGPFLGEGSGTLVGKRRLSSLKSPESIALVHSEELRDWPAERKPSVNDLAYSVADQ